jgi:uncharacterized protein
MVLPIPLDTLVFLLGTFVAAFVTGISGFAFGMVAAAIWLLALAPVQTTAMIIAYGLLVQGYAVWKLRKSIIPARLWPFVAGSAIGVPAGLVLLNWVSPMKLRFGVAVLLTLFSLYNLVRPRMPNVARAGRMGDGSIGVLNGLLGGSTGLAGIVVVVWSSMRGWRSDEQRAVFQPTGVATFLMCIFAFGGTGMISPDLIRLFVSGLPALLLGTLAGWALYGKLNEIAFRKVVLWLLLAFGVLLLVTSR